MPRNATHIWSGYSHQGRVGLLVALRKINSLGQHADLSLYNVEYETQEDVKITENNLPVEVHQVKAYTNSTTKGSYTGALEIFEACPNGNYLHTLCEITNWNEITVVQNPGAVELYEYNTDVFHCSLDHITGYIDAEIQELLTREGSPEALNHPWRQQSFQEFLAQLDDKIRFEHHNHNIATYRVVFSLRELKNLIIAHPVGTRSKIYSIREDFNETFVRFLQQLDHMEIELDAIHEAAVIKVINDICTLSDERLLKFLRNINPHTTSGVDFSSQPLADKYYTSDSFYSVFIYTVIKITTIAYNIDQHFIPSYFKGQGYLVTSINSGPNMRSQHAMNILKNDQVDYAAYENAFIISQNYEGQLSDIANRFYKKDENRILNKKDMSFIRMEDAIQHLNE